MQECIKKVNENGGVVTIDVCLKRNGSLLKEQIDVLKTISIYGLEMYSHVNNRR